MKQNSRDKAAITKMEQKVKAAPGWQKPYLTQLLTNMRVMSKELNPIKLLELAMKQKDIVDEMNKSKQ